MNRRAFVFSFAWLFAIIAGAVILFIAIFATTRFIDTEGEISETTIGKEISTLLTPIETSTEEGKFSKITLTEEGVISNECNDRGTFGSQGIRVGDGIASTFFNKYIFSDGEIEGRELFVFNKPFNMPFKVGDLTMIWTDKQQYCFVGTPNVIERDIDGLALTNIISVTSIGDCAVGSTRVCFGSTGCDVNVDLTQKSVDRGGDRVFYDDTFGTGLLYGAIFADSDIYECQVKRLMGRTSELSLIYLEKNKRQDVLGCSLNVDNDLDILAKSLDIESSAEIGAVVSLASNIDGKNEFNICRLY